jgi:LuxR family maltose regulon positive regulatory protein
MVLARLLLAQNRFDEARGLLQYLLEVAETGERTARMIEILILQALVFQAEGNTDQAITTLEQSLTLAEPGGFVRVYIDEGPPIASLLYQAASRGIAPAYTRQLLAAIPAVETEQADTLDHQAQSIELLSEREIEVLQLIAEGLTNQEIATKLFLSPHTIKVHTRNIYSKLDTHNRTESVSKARLLGFLPPT